MVIFSLLSVLLVILAILFIVFFSFRKSTQQQPDIDQKQINVDIAREQLEVLELNLNSGEISKEEYESIKYEIEGSLIDDIAAPETTQDEVQVPTGKFSNKLAIIIIAIFVPLTTLLGYWKLGTPDALNIDMQAAMQQANQQSGGTSQQASVEQMLNGLMAKLKENPSDEKGWSLLGRTFMAVKRYDEAYQVYGKLLQLKGKDDPDVLVSMADALAMVNDGHITGEPEHLIQRALKVDANNITALWLAGLASEEQRKHEAAIAYWKRILPLVKDDPTSTQQVKDMIAQARGTLKTSTPKAQEEDSSQSQANTAMTGASIKVHVALDANLAQKAQPEDIIFVFAKATQGPPMPLAAVKMRVKDMPIDVVLDDSQAMMPNMKISSFKQVAISARVSKSGSPTGQKGDLESPKVIVDLSDIKPIKLVIATEIQ